MEPISKILGRAWKRVAGQPVTLADYDEIWAEISEKGDIVHNSQSDTPAMRIHAVREDDNRWTVTTEKRHMVAPLGTDIMGGGISCVFDQYDSLKTNMPHFYYEPVGEKRTMTSSEVIQMMKSFDPDPRGSSQHYSRALART